MKLNFDLESVLGYFTDGRLTTWLTDRYYDEKAEAVSALLADMPDLNAKLCEILEVEYQAENDETDVELIARRKEKLFIISSITDNKEILNNVDLVAMSQAELFDILDEKPEKVYLYGDKFEISIGAKNIFYMGINEPLVILEKDKHISDYKKNGITFSQVMHEDNADINGEKLFLEGNYKEAFPLIKEEAINSNPRAMFIMTLYYENGYETVKIDDKEKLLWYKKALPYNYPLISYWYAFNCLNAKTTKQKEIFLNCIDEIRIMAEKGDVFAQDIIARAYYSGIAIEKDYSKSVEWAIKSANQGFSRSDTFLGYRYKSGNGISADKMLALKLIEKAALKGDAIAQYYLGKEYSKGDLVTQDNKKAIEWYKKGAENGDNSSMLNIGDIYKDGNGVTKDINKALEWFMLAAENGSTLAECRIGDIYCDISDYKNAVEWYKKAAERNDIASFDAQNKLGVRYLNGEGVTKDKEKAIELFKKAAPYNLKAKENLEKLGIYIQI